MLKFILILNVQNKTETRRLLIKEISTEDVYIGNGGETGWLL